MRENLSNRFIHETSDSIQIIAPENVIDGYRELLIKALGTTENEHA